MDSRRESHQQRSISNMDGKRRPQIVKMMAEAPKLCCCLVCVVIAVVVVLGVGFGVDWFQCTRCSTYSVRFFEDSDGSQEDSGLQCGESWCVQDAGAFSFQDETGYSGLPFPNDEVRHVQIEDGWCLYMTDLDTFETGGDGEFLQQGPFEGDISGPIGKVSSAAVWDCDDFDLDDYEFFLAEQRLEYCNEFEVLVAEDTEGTGDIGCFPVGAYSKDGEGGYRTMTDIYPNDEITYVIVPEGMSAYVTDEDTFGEGSEGVQEITGLFFGVVTPAGKVSSIAVWKTAEYASLEEFLLLDLADNVCGDVVGVVGAEDDDFGGDSWCIPIGAYSKDGEAGYDTMTDVFPNDELSYIVVPEGLSCYVTNEDSFSEDVDDDGTDASEHVGPYAGIVGPVGLVSSIAVWDSTLYSGYEEFLATYS